MTNSVALGLIRAVLVIPFLAAAPASMAKSPTRSVPAHPPVKTAPALPPATSAEVIDATEAVRVAVAAKDYRQAILLNKAWAERHPTDLDFLHSLPLLYNMAGDQAGWEQARIYMTAAWASIKVSVRPPSMAGFLIDSFQVGPDTVIAEQCFEKAGRFGVTYKFGVVGAAGQITSFFAVEASDLDNQIAKDMGRPPVSTLDHFAPGKHETVAMLRGSPEYPELRKKVTDYLMHPAAASSSASGPGLSKEGCEFLKTAG